jgi:N-glycosylase/DNA lyase
MDGLVSSVKSLKNTPAAKIIASRMADFRAAGSSSPERIFSELCFCILTANYSAQGGIRIQEEVGGGFLKLGRATLAKKLKSLGHRFPNARARYISDSKTKIPQLLEALKLDDHTARAWLVGNIYGLGYKEASHFLRNTGRRGLAIVDFHVIDLLCDHGIIKRPKSKALGRKRYEEIESELAKIAGRCGLCQGELDLYLWYMETGKILK